MIPMCSVGGTHGTGMQACACAAVFALLMGSAPRLWADADSDRAQVVQKMSLAARLLSDPPATERIMGSGSRPAVGHLDEGRVHHALAADLLARGEVDAAHRAVDEALRHLGMARRMVPDATARRAAARTRHAQLMDSTERLIEAWRERVGSQAQGDGSDLTAALGLIAVARRLARDGNYDESNQALARAERHVLSGMNQMLHAATLDYTLRSNSPAEMFDHEMARRRDFAELLPLAVRDLRPPPEAVSLIDRYTETSNTFQTLALQQRHAGNIAQALAHIRNATLYLQRALLAAGLVSPQANESQP